MTSRLLAACPTNIVRDARTVAAMVTIYCRDKHRQPGGALCDSCARLLTYAEARLMNCPFGSRKTTCARCPIHCYRATERAAMKEIMRYAGPRMLRRHPILALRHLWLERQPPPAWPMRRAPKPSVGGEAP